MTKSTRALSGAAKDTFLEGMVGAALGDDHEARDRVLKDLTDAIASLRVRVDAERGHRAISDWTQRVLSVADTAIPAPLPAPAAGAADVTDEAPSSCLELSDSPHEFGQAVFDPYDPNVIVVVRTKGREAALSALAQISRESDLRLLAHEQQLGIPGDATSLPAICEAIVAAAERRIANRRAAGS